MVCGPYTYSPRGRSGLGVIQPQSGLDYPLIAPSEDIRYLIADLYLEYDDPGLYSAQVAESVHPLKIKWLYGVGCEESSAPSDVPTPTHSADILIVDSENNTVFDSTVADNYASRNWGADYKIYEWTTGAAICRLVVYTTWAPDEAAVRTYPTHISPANAVIDERAIYKMPKRVKSIKVLTTTVQGAAVDLLCGYNIGLDTVANTARGLRHTNELTINADAGLGIGRYSDCVDEDPPIVLLNGVTGPETTISATDCLWFRVAPEVTQPTRETSLGSNCPACCACMDYVNTARYMNCSRNRYIPIGELAHETLLKHTDNVARWVEQRECRIKKPLKVIMTPQKCPEVDVVVQFCNLCEECAEDVNVNITFGTYPSGGNVNILHCYTVLSAGAARNFPYRIPTVSANNFAVNFGKVSAGNSANVKFRVEVTPAVAQTLYVNVTGTKNENGLTVPLYAGCAAAAGTADAGTTVALACDNDGNTVRVC